MSPRFPNVLVVDDCSTSQSLLCVELCAAGYQVAFARDGIEALRRIEDRAPDYLITDWQMPRMDGESLCRCIRTAKLDQYLYILMMTAFPTRMDLINGLQAGADAYIKKPIDLPELMARLECGSRVLELDRRLTKDAERDPLTGVLNRRNFVDSVSRILALKNPVSSIMLDLDFFKSVNDQLGHLAGDSVIIQVANVLKSTFRSSDYICRFGGEEFSIILPDCNEQQAAASAERCRAEIEANVRIPDGTGTRSITASFGVAESQSVEEPLKLLENADRALLKAKGMGRNRVVQFSTLRPCVSFDRAFDASSAATSAAGLANSPVGLFDTTGSVS